MLGLASSGHFARCCDEERKICGRIYRDCCYSQPKSPFGPRLHFASPLCSLSRISFERLSWFSVMEAENECFACTRATSIPSCNQGVILCSLANGASCNNTQALLCKRMGVRDASLVVSVLHILHPVKAVSNSCARSFPCGKEHWTQRYAVSRTQLLMHFINRYTIYRCMYSVTLGYIQSALSSGLLRMGPTYLLYLQLSLFFLQREHKYVGFVGTYFFSAQGYVVRAVYSVPKYFCDPVKEWPLLLLVGALLLMAANVALCRPMLCCCGPVFRPLCVCLLVRILYERCNLEHRAYSINVEAGFLFVSYSCLCQSTKFRHWSKCQWTCPKMLGSFLLSVEYRAVLLVSVKTLLNKVWHDCFVLSVESQNQPEWGKVNLWHCILFVCNVYLLRAFYLVFINTYKYMQNPVTQKHVSGDDLASSI